MMQEEIVYTIITFKEFNSLKSDELEVKRSFNHF